MSFFKTAVLGLASLFTLFFVILFAANAHEAVTGKQNFTVLEIVEKAGFGSLILVGALIILSATTIGLTNLSKVR